MAAVATNMSTLAIPSIGVETKTILPSPTSTTLSPLPALLPRSAAVFPSLQVLRPFILSSSSVASGTTIDITQEQLESRLDSKQSLRCMRIEKMPVLYYAIVTIQVCSFLVYHRIDDQFAACDRRISSYEYSMKVLKLNTIIKMVRVVKVYYIMWLRTAHLISSLHY
jgi:hypothetical protein